MISQPGTWKEVPAPDPGLYNLGSHMLDQVLVLFGLPHYLDARTGIQRPGGKVDDFYDIRLEYKDFHVIVKSSYLVKEQGPRYIVHGTRRLVCQVRSRYPGTGSYTKEKTWWPRVGF